MPGSTYAGQLYPALYGDSTAAVPADVAVSQLLVETLDVVPASALSVTQVVAEILFATPNEARVTQLACEVIIVPLLPERPDCIVDFPIDVAPVVPNCPAPHDEEE